MEKKTEAFEKEEEHTFGKQVAAANLLGLSTASEEHSSGDDSSFLFSRDMLGATMKGTSLLSLPGSFEADMIDDEFNSDNKEDTTKSEQDFETRNFFEMDLPTLQHIVETQDRMIADYEQ